MLLTVLYGHGDSMLKKKINGSWQLLSAVKKKINGSWQDCSIVRKKVNGIWSTVWQRIFIDWVFGDALAPYGFGDYDARSAANFGITVEAYYPGSSSAYVRIATASNIFMNVNETLYADYSISTSGTNPFFECQMVLGNYSGGSSSIYAQSDTGYSGGTISMTRTGSNATAPLNIFLRARSGSSSNSGATLTVTKIYNDSKIFYWNTKTIV